MDNTLGTLVEQYKSEPSPRLRRMIWNCLLSEEISDALKNIRITPESDWIIFDNTIQAKRIVDRKYLVAEVFYQDQTILGFCYLVNINCYSEGELQSFKKNCQEYAATDPTGDFHAAVAVAMASEVRDAKSTCNVTRKEELQQWLDRLASEIKV